MRKEHQDTMDPKQPALLVRCGATRRKCRPLAGEVVLLGRAPGCDIGLVSPEVAPVHCVIVRTSLGWRIRDCSGRSTQVNGKSILDEPLSNGDVIQVGTFSFEAHLPPIAPSKAQAVASPAVPAPPAPPAPSGMDDAERRRLQMSRRRLAELALNLRRRLREQTGERDELQRQLQDLEQVERRVRNAQKELQAMQLKQKEADHKVETRGKELDAYARNLRRQAEQLRKEQQEQARLAELDNVGFEEDLIRQLVEIKQDREQLMEWQQGLQVRQSELEVMGEQLEQMLSSEKERLDRERAQVDKEREYLDSERQALLKERAELEQLREQPASPVAAPVVSVANRETQMDPNPPDRLESARRLLRELSERRKAMADAAAPVPGSLRPVK